MEITRCHLFYFSPCGGTKRVADALVKNFPWPVEQHNLLRPIKPLACAENELAVFAFPVYSGRVPGIGPGAFSNLAGDGTPAVLLTVYGNRAIDEAAIDLDRLAKEKKFVPVAAVTAVAEHSIFTNVAAGRPDETDRALLADCAAQLLDYLGKLKMSFRRTFHPPGIEIIPKQLPSDLFAPSVKQDVCTLCKKCVPVCPTGAIDPNAPNTTYVPQCLWCQACIRACPENARFLNHPSIPDLAAGMEQRCATRLNPQLWLP